MSESQILLLGPGGNSARIPLPDDIPVNELQSAIGHALGLPGHELILRKQGGKLINQRGSLLDAAVRPGDMVLVVDAGVWPAAELAVDEGPDGSGRIGGGGRRLGRVPGAAVLPGG